MTPNIEFQDRIKTTFEAQFEFIREYNHRSLSPGDFSDLFAADLDRVTERFKAVNRWRISFDQLRCSTLPEITRRAERCEALESTLREKACDFEILGREAIGLDHWLNDVWDEMLPTVTSLRDAVAEFVDAILQCNQEDGLVGRKETHNECCRATWVDIPQDERVLRKERIRRRFFEPRVVDGSSQARPSYPIQQVTYFPKQIKKKAIFTSLGFSRKRMKSLAADLPELIRPLARLEYGHRADGVGEHVMLFLVDDFVLAGQRVPSPAPPRLNAPEPKPRMSSLWRALRGLRSV